VPTGGVEAAATALAAALRDAGRGATIVA
jgi:hypothetical protein